MTLRTKTAHPSCTENKKKSACARSGDGADGKRKDAVGSQPLLDDGGGVNRAVIPVEKSLQLHQDRPLLLQMFHKETQDLNDLGHVDNGGPGNDVGVDEALAVKEGQQHLFGLAGMDLAFNGPGCPFFNNYWECFFV